MSWFDALDIQGFCFFRHKVSQRYQNIREISFSRIKHFNCFILKSVGNLVFRCEGHHVRLLRADASQSLLLTILDTFKHLTKNMVELSVKPDQITVWNIHRV